MENRITSIRYNAGKLEAIKRAVTFIFLLAIMLYALIEKGLTNKHRIRRSRNMC